MDHADLGRARVGERGECVGPDRKHEPPSSRRQATVNLMFRRLWTCAQAIDLYHAIIAERRLRNAIDFVRALFRAREQICRESSGSYVLPRWRVHFSCGTFTD